VRGGVEGCEGEAGVLERVILEHDAEHIDEGGLEVGVECLVGICESVADGLDGDDTNGGVGSLEVFLCRLV
jgi:hypothetical protein